MTMTNVVAQKPQADEIEWRKNKEEKKEERDERKKTRIKNWDKPD